MAHTRAPTRALSGWAGPADAVHQPWRLACIGPCAGRALRASPWNTVACGWPGVQAEGGAGAEAAIRERERQLLPVYHQVALQFAQVGPAALQRRRRCCAARRSGTPRQTRRSGCGHGLSAIWTPGLPLKPPALAS